MQEQVDNNIIVACRIVSSVKNVSIGAVVELDYLVTEKLLIINVIYCNVQ